MQGAGRGDCQVSSRQAVGIFPHTHIERHIIASVGHIIVHEMFAYDLQKLSHVYLHFFIIVNDIKELHSKAKYIDCHGSKDQP